jgi:hypothetical protein
MNENLFWHAISLFDWNKAGDDTSVMGRAIDALSRLSLDDLKQFDDILAEKLYALDGLAYANNLAPEDAYDGGNFSADYFLFARCSVVANGRDYYDHVLSNPWDMPKNAAYEPLLYLTYYTARQKGYDDYQPMTPANAETFRNQAGWQSA